MPSLELPRLTGSLRAFSGLSAPNIQVENSAELTKLLQRKRKLRVERQVGNKWSWPQLKDFLLDACADKSSKQEVGAFSFHYCRDYGT